MLENFCVQAISYDIMLELSFMMKSTLLLYV